MHGPSRCIALLFTLGAAACSLVRTPDDLGAGGPPLDPREGGAETGGWLEAGTDGSPLDGGVEGSAPDGGMPDVIAPAEGGAEEGGALPSPVNFRASTDASTHVVLEWQAPAGPAPQHYELAASHLTSTPSIQSKGYKDTSAKQGSISTTLSATSDRSDGILLTFTSTASAGPKLTYKLVAVYDAGRSPAVEATGSRAAPAIGAAYVQRGDAGWSALPVTSPHLDTTASSTSVTATVSTTPSIPLGAIGLEATLTEHQVPLAYRVRVDSEIGSFESSAATGYRPSTSTTLQWDRSADGKTWAELADVTGRVWFDPSPPTGQKLWYRVRMFGDAGMSTAVAGTSAILPVVASVHAASYSAGHSCALQSDKLVACWGNDTRGQVSGVPSRELFQELSVGFSHVCGVTTAGLLRCWGSNQDGEAPNLTRADYAGVAAGQHFSCARRKDGKVECFGANDKGQAPAGPSATSFTSLAAGAYTTCGLRTDSTPECWGWDNAPFDGLGLVLGAPSSTPLAQLSVAGQHACGVTAQGTGRCWGYSGYAPPLAYGPFGKLVAVGFGTPSRTLAIRADTGRLYIESPDSVFGLPSLRLASAGPYKDIAGSTGSDDALSGCALETSGRLRCFGANQNGEAPAIPPPERVIAVGAAQWTTCYVRVDGTIDCRGDNSGRELTDLPTVETFTEVGTGCGLRTGGGMQCWGYLAGQVGGSRAGPFQRVATGTNHVCALSTSGAVSCWGDDTSGQSTPPTTVGPAHLLASGHGTSCAANVAGGLVCWGLNDDKQASPPAALDHYRSLSVGGRHACGVTTGGSVRCWGRDDKLQVSKTPSSDAGYTSVAAGGQHSCALRSDGRVVCWGDNTYGQAPTGPSIDRYKSLAAGAVHTCGIREDDHLVCWGSDGYGQAPRP